MATDPQICLSPNIAINKRLNIGPHPSRRQNIYSIRMARKKTTALQGTKLYNFP